MDTLELKQEVYDFIDSLKITGPVLHTNPRFLLHDKNFDMSFWSQPDYIDLHFSALDLVPGNEFNWKEQPVVKMKLEFEDIWVKATIHAEYIAEKFVPLTKFIEENGLTLYVPEVVEEKENQSSVGQAVAKRAGRNRRLISYFQVDGLALFDIDVLKQFIMVFDEQMTNYSHEVS